MDVLLESRSEPLGEAQACVLARKNFLDEDTQRRFYTLFTERGCWEQRTNKLFGKEIAQPRLNFNWGVDYSYSGGTNTTKLMDPEINDAIIQIKNQIESFLSTRGIGIEFNECLVQYYRDKNDCVFPHCDNEKGLDPAALVDVAIVTLTEKTDRILRYTAAGNDVFYRFGKAKEAEKYTKHEKLVDVPLHPGCLLLMSGNSDHLRHEVPRTRDEVVGRISLSFRRFVS